MLVESKSNLARLMATENLLVEQRQVATACFDIKNRILTVPVLNGNLSNELIDLLLGHEVGHALETPERGWHDSVVDLKVNRSILNVCEDSRIEKKIKRKFPGIRISFLKGYHELIEMDFFGVKGKNLNELNFIDRINLYTKGGAAQGIDFTDDEYELVREVEAAETFEETVAISMKIQKFMEEETKTKKTQAQKSQDTGEAPDSTEEGDEEATGDKEATEQDIPEGTTTSSSTEESEDEDNKTVDTNTPPSGGTESAEEETLESQTDNVFREKERELYKADGTKDIVYSNIPKILTEKVIVSHKTLIKEIETYNTDKSLCLDQHFRPEVMRQNFSKFRTESNKVVSYLVKEFEMRKNAEQQARAKISKTGELNLSKIHEYKFTDDIFARMTKVPNGKSHGLIMFIDWSGSMCDHIGPTVKQLLNLVMFCKKVNIPFEVYAFSTNVMGNSSDHKAQEFKVGDLAIGRFSLLNVLSSKMSANDFSKMASYLLDFGLGRRGTCLNMEPPEIIQLSGTPLNETILAAFEIIPEFKKQNKLQIVNTVFLTDGEGSSLSFRIEAVSGDVYDTYESSNITASWNRRSFLRDTVTKASVEVNRVDYNTSLGAVQTTALLKLLKQRTDSNIVGFYIAKARDVRTVLNVYSPKNETQKIDNRVAEFRKNHFTYLNNVGYDEYYFLRSDKLDTDDEDGFEVSSTTTRGLVSAFTKYTGNRVSNRIVLNRFINFIT
jgi:hypothetical protein